MNNKAKLWAIISFTPKTEVTHEVLVIRPAGSFRGCGLHGKIR
jgi:hypothetical protein